MDCGFFTFFFLTDLANFEGATPTIVRIQKDPKKVEREIRELSRKVTTTFETRAYRMWRDCMICPCEASRPINGTCITLQVHEKADPSHAFMETDVGAHGKNPEGVRRARKARTYRALARIVSLACPDMWNRTCLIAGHVALILPIRSWYVCPHQHAHRSEVA